MTEAEQNRLVVDNMGIVSVVAADFRGADIEYEDLLAVGRIGLVVAARNFDPSLGKFSEHASARVRTEISNAIRSGDYERAHTILDEEEEVKYWESWGHFGNATAIFEAWPEYFDSSPEALSVLYDDIRDKKQKFDAAFISLTPLERKAVQLVYLLDPALSITNAAREMRISYLRTWRTLERALRKMRKIIYRIESNSEDDKANGSPLHARPSRLSSREAA